VEALCGCGNFLSSGHVKKKMHLYMTLKQSLKKWPPKTTQLINKVEAKLKELRVPYTYLGPSERKGKKLQITLPIDGIIKTVHFGDINSQTYIEFRDEKKRRAYIARHSKILLKDGSRAIDKMYSPSWMAYHILW
jgi:hypothetical protein